MRPQLDFKAMLRNAGERTVSGLCNLIGQLVAGSRLQGCANPFSPSGQDPD